MNSKKKVKRRELQKRIIKLRDIKFEIQMRRQASISRSFSSLHCIPNSQTAQMIRKRMKSLSSKPPGVTQRRERCLSLSSSALLLMNGSFKNIKDRAQNKSPDKKEPDNLPSHRSTTATSTKSSSEKMDDKAQGREKMGPSPFKSQSQPQQKFLKRAPRIAHARRKLNSSVIIEMMGPEIEKYANRRSVESTPRNKRLTSFHRHSYLNLTSLKSDLHSLSVCKERERSFTRTKHSGMTSQEHSLSTPRIHLEDTGRSHRFLQTSPLVKVQDYLKGTPKQMEDTIQKKGRELEQLRLASKRMESVKVRHKKTLTEVKENSKTVQNSIECVLERRIRNLNRNKQVKIEIESVRREIERLKEAADYKRKTVKKVKDFIRENTFDLHSQQETLQLLEKENFILKKLLKNAKHINDNLRAKNMATQNKLDKTKLMAEKMMENFQNSMQKSGSHPSLKQFKF